MDRREFIKGAALGVGVGAIGAMGAYSYSPMRRAFLKDVKRGTADIGVCKAIKITNISETSWFDNGTFMKDVTGAGGLLVDQYTFNWPPFGNGKGIGKGSYADGMKLIKHLLPNKLEEAWQIVRENSVHSENAGGFSCLVEIEAMDGKVTKYLFDTGWNYLWMDTCYKREGIDTMLANNEIAAMIQTHEHMDHYFGLPAVTKYNPNIHIYTPNTFYPNGKQYLKDSGHVGKWTEVPKGLHKIQEGVALYGFDCPIIFKVFGEMSLYCNVKDIGLVSITGCCHQGIILFADTAYKTIAYENDQFYGLYGGLHISPFDDWDPKYDDLVIGLKKWDLQRVGCNHCTGLITAQKFVDAGYPVVKGTARFRSKTTNYLGNGDVIKFPS
ncbi:twin-arginine translocation signal domain-containing protein [Desulfovibrio desulfuricans]|uniref:twin-arginine translocation signal domain-containing protein n=1 Tax=Desulfovibrio desulfuricans TaxID=876 RepID=UPI001D05C90A|nr:twin-arginine translocation signal domain-containing protein [Desulfovibrio desulfuricans]MCB6542004.1 twin-arginine translocation signal domain-containing protein [Desulfovibrio desulfuricans]MCB6553085.1 twin-arginine translocation signal domain-containing protein [Desulfovibrio desulfuricans]MCB6565047.1 twin-arginine translocation signal domain-containing protein [Desulfovibrio desulfuricans]MCB7346005.1 twin-arginine translocation signal domain-containing protein [Desulfovibrio desulfur